MERKVLFDLDGTLMTGDYHSTESKYFTQLYGDKAYSFLDGLVKYLDEYEHRFKRYEIDVLSSFLTDKAGFLISEKDINGWIECIAEIDNVLEDGIIDVLEYFQSQRYTLGVLTNWVKRAQEKRLINMGIRDYFSELYTGDIVLKPHLETYYVAIGKYPKEKCVIIGDNSEKDYGVPMSIGINSYLYDKKDKYPEITKNKVKKLNEIIRYY